MCFNGQFSRECAITQDLNELGFSHETSLVEFSYADLLQFFRFSESLESREVDSLIFHTVDILKAELRQTTLHRHLTTLETDFLAITGARFSTLVTTGRSTAESRTGTSADATARVG